jgi:hypothetical protein
MDNVPIEMDLRDKKNDVCASVAVKYLQDKGKMGDNM